jgi:pimeloyl-ACP methyl ester carboxylesterase
LPHPVRQASADRGDESAGHLDRPALVLWSQNPVMPADHARRLADLLPAGRLQMIDDAYVLVMLDQPQRTAAALAAFLSAEGRPRRADAGVDPDRPVR